MSIRRTIHIVAFVCQAALVIFLCGEFLKNNDSNCFLGALGWWVATVYNLGRFNTRTE
jgi:hypothetical protein